MAWLVTVAHQTSWCNRPVILHSVILGHSSQARSRDRPSKKWTHSNSLCLANQVMPGIPSEGLSAEPLPVGPHRCLKITEDFQHFFFWRWLRLPSSSPTKPYLTTFFIVIRWLGCHPHDGTVPKDPGALRFADGPRWVWYTGLNPGQGGAAVSMICPTP